MTIEETEETWVDQYAREHPFRWRWARFCDWLAYLRPPRHPHVSAGIACLVLHYDEPGQCVQCKLCGEFLRPSEFSGTCSSWGDD